MHSDYVRSRIQDALQENGGNIAKAQRTLLRWTIQDQILRDGLTTPHLQGIVAHALHHVINTMATDKDGTTNSPKPAIGVGELGEALIQSLQQGDMAAFGQAHPRNVGRPKQTSARHVQAIEMLARAQKNNKE